MPKKKKDDISAKQFLKMLALADSMFPGEGAVGGMSPTDAPFQLPGLQAGQGQPLPQAPADVLPQFEAYGIDPTPDAFELYMQNRGQMPDKDLFALIKRIMGQQAGGIDMRGGRPDPLQLPRPV